MQDHRHARLVINKAEERAGRRGRWYLPNKQGVLTVCMGDLADATIVIGILAQVFFLEYYGLGRYLNWVITGMICVRALFSGWKYSGRALLLGLITVAGWLSGALLGGNMETFRANILLLLYPFVYTLYFFLLVTNKRDFLLGLFDAGFPVFNAILLLNMAIMFIQYSTHGMIAATTNDISYFEDNISGLFSYASVHAVALYTSFVVLYNFVWIRRLRGPLWPSLAIAYNVCLIVLSFYLATLNDNKALFIILPLVLVMFWLISVMRGEADVSAPFFWLVALYFILTIAYALVPAFQILVDTQVFGLFDMVGSSAAVGTAADGSNERIAIIGFALLRPATWSLGEGLGASSFYASGFMSFNHFGQADMGSFLILMGVWETAAYVAFFHSVVSEFMEQEKGSNGRIVRLLLLLTILITFLYTQCFTRVNCCLCLLLLCGALAWSWNSSAADYLIIDRDEEQV